MPAMHPLTLLTVHAHPDDETISTGGVMARYSRDGVRVVCVTCTWGENGEIVVPEMDTPENHARLGEIRRGELAAALAALGPIESRVLGYRDSGMMGLPENDDPRAFWQADVDEAAGRLVRIVREVRPDVVVGYNDFGGYGHPDHIRAAQLAKLAFARAGDPGSYPEQLREGLEPFAPVKLYESIILADRREQLGTALVERGVESWWAPKADETDEQRAEREGWFAKMAAAQGPLTTRVDVSPWFEAKREALAAHATQITATNPFYALPPDVWRELAPTEDFTLRESHVGVRIPEDDLFQGLRAG
jgi:mycothiol conjugate amidase Mca